MGNKVRPTTRDLKVRPQEITRPTAGGHRVGVTDSPLVWSFALDDPTSAATRMEPGLAVRGVQDHPRFRVLAGADLIGLVPEAVSSEMLAALARGGVLLGHIVDVRRQPLGVYVRLEIRGR